MPTRVSAPRWGSPSSSADILPDSGPELEPPRKRLRVRKGTKSCWECKRRKIRCTFAASADALCNGCARRGTACIGQEFPDEPSTLVSTSTDTETQPGGGDRLGRVEALVELLIRNPNANPIGRGNADGSLGSDDLSGVRPRKRPTSRDACTPQSRTSSPESSTGILTAPATGHASQAEVLVTSKHDDLSRALLAAWPSSDDIEVILRKSFPVGITFAGILHKIDYIPRAAFDKDSPSQGAPPIPLPRDVLRLPPPGSHPVLIARRLLLLGVYLQSLKLQGKYRDIMSHVVETAIRLVTTNDELTGSLEGIECITLESLYQDNVGNLRRAWLATRRAVAVAQMMGLHRGAVNASLLKILEPETRTRIDPEYLWFRLVQTDRYFSLMLGLPHSSPESVFATPKVLERCTPVERMRRLNSVAGGHILQRNHEDNGDDLAVTHEIDQLLQKSSANMPAQWWLSYNEAKTQASSPGDEDDDGERRIMEETARITDQLSHYQLLVQLHLPYLFRSPAQRKYDYSKMTAVHASRELLRRFLAFRAIHPVGSYCRGFDFNAFIATAALCLAHMEARRQVRAEDGAGGGSVLGFLAHQRPADRGMMECAVDNMEKTAAACCDALATKVAMILRQLLAIEADAAAGGQYSANSSPAGPNQHGDSFASVSGLDEGGNVLRIFIPYFGTVKIERGGVDTSVLSMMPPASGDQDERELELDAQGVSARDHDLFNGSSSAQDAQLLAPELAAGVDDWALQGVDLAFFDNLMRGAEMDEAAGGSWAPWDSGGPLLQ